MIFITELTYFVQLRTVRNSDVTVSTFQILTVIDELRYKLMLCSCIIF